MSNTSSSIEQTAWRGFTRTMLIALPLAVLGFLAIGGFFGAYEGTAVAHRPVAGSDGVDDEVRRFILEREDGTWFEVVLPTEAFEGKNLPQSPTGAPPREMPDDAVEVFKSRFTLHVRIGGAPHATASGLDLILPLAFLLLVAVGRNLAVTGSAFQVVPTGKDSMPVPIQTPHGQLAQGPSNQARKQRPKKGPPPPRGKGKKRRRKKR